MIQSTNRNGIAGICLMSLIHVCVVVTVVSCSEDKDVSKTFTSRVDSIFNGGKC